MSEKPSGGDSPSVHEWRPGAALLFTWLFWTALLGVCLAFGAAGAAAPFGAPSVMVFWCTALAIWLFFGGVSALHFRSLVYTLDANYITKVSGRIWWHRRAVPLDQITSLDVRRGPCERILGVGQIWIFTPSSVDMTPEEKLMGVKEPDKVRETILDACHRAKHAAHTTAPRDTERETPELHEILETIRRSLDTIRSAPPDNQPHSPPKPNEPDDQG